MRLIILTKYHAEAVMRFFTPKLTRDNNSNSTGFNAKRDDLFWTNSGRRSPQLLNRMTTYNEVGQSY